MGLIPLPISKDFSPQKVVDLILFFFFFLRNFHKSGPISKGFSAVKTADFTIFSAILVKWNPLLRIFFTKMGPLSKDVL